MKGQGGANQKMTKAIPAMGGGVYLRVVMKAFVCEVRVCVCDAG